MADLSKYLDAAAVAERIGVAGRRVITEYLSRGDMPEPDLVWLNHPLWLVETIDEWRRWKGKHNKPPQFRRGRRAERVRTRPAELVLEMPPPPSSNGASRKRKRSSSAAAPVSLRGAPSIEKSKLVARALRDEGHHCTVDDVRELAVTKGELPHERDVLRARVRQKLKEVTT